VIGVDAVEHEGAGDRLDGFVVSDLNHGIPPSVGRGYDVVLAADVIDADLLVPAGADAVARFMTAEPHGGGECAEQLARRCAAQCAAR
jgi:hypothetical protein